MKNDQLAWVGTVRLSLGDEIVTLPVQALPLEQDVQGSMPGGFFVAASGSGILLNSALNPEAMRQQFSEACAEAAKHFSKRTLN